MSASPSRRLLTAALAAAAQGWPVFPLRPYGKRPAIKGWPQRATRDPGQLAAWWNQAPYNVGLACGPAGLLVVDLDCPPAGRAAFAALPGHADSPTYRVTTPSGGEHRYYSVSPGQPARSTAGLLGSHVDTRGAGGYVVAAGSVLHFGTGTRWYRIADLRLPAPMPPWLTSLLTARVPLALSEPLSMPYRYSAAALAGECDLVRRSSPGARNVTLFRAALRLGSLAGTGTLDPSVAASHLRNAADVHCGIEGFTVGEAERTIANGLRYGQARPRQVPAR